MLKSKYFSVYTYYCCILVSNISRKLNFCIIYKSSSLRSTHKCPEKYQKIVSEKPNIKAVAVPWLIFQIMLKGGNGKLCVLEEKVQKPRGSSKSKSRLGLIHNSCDLFTQPVPFFPLHFYFADSGRSAVLLGH